MKNLINIILEHHFYRGTKNNDEISDLKSVIIRRYTNKLGLTNCANVIKN